MELWKWNPHRSTRQDSPNIEERLGFMHLDVTDGTVFAGFQVANDAHLTNCQPTPQEKCHRYTRPESGHVKPDWSRHVGDFHSQLWRTLWLTGVEAFDDCCRVDEISSTQHAHEVWIELSDLYSGGAMHFVWKTGEGGNGGRRGGGPARKEEKRNEVVKRQNGTCACFGSFTRTSSLPLTRRQTSAADLQPAATWTSLWSQINHIRSISGAHIKILKPEH